jgi:hypothetical protein
MPSKSKPKKPTPPKQTSSKNVSSWEDDPGVPPNSPITVAAPNQSAKPLPFKIGGTAPAPAVYAVGTAQFRYYATAVALRRTADFWGSIVPSQTKWHVGATLPVILDDGVDLNAFYTRGDFQDAPGLHFFHDTVAGQTYYSGESPDVCCHEMGHAVLDAIKPQLFDAQTIEAAAFHESFGDMSALLSALQTPSFRQEVIQETGGTLNRSSRLSRLAEQLGYAIRVQHPDAVDPDCLRNAVNSFFYRDPQALPPSAPANALSSEPHSFSRVFTGAFLDILAGIAKVLNSSPGTDDIGQATQDAAHILVNGVLGAPVTPDFYSQVAAQMIAVSQIAPFDGKYRDIIKSAFVRRGILSLQAAATVSSIQVKNLAPRMAMDASQKSAPAELPKANISAAVYGLAQPTLVVHTAEDAKHFAVTSAALTGGPIGPSSPQSAAESYTEDLFQRGRVEVGKHAHSQTGLTHPLAYRTHFIIEVNGQLILKRRSFECGFDL